MVFVVLMKSMELAREGHWPLGMIEWRHEGICQAFRGCFQGIYHVMLTCFLSDPVSLREAEEYRCSTCIKDAPKNINVDATRFRLTASI